MKIRTSELKGQALDWAVAKCEGREPVYDMQSHGTLWTGWWLSKGGEYEQLPSYSTGWSQGGPIIEREDISFRKYHRPKSETHGTYYAMVCQESGTTIHWKGWGARTQTGPTPLIAAMRCYVASKIGDEVDIPNELQ